jgi:hypothetical protein
MALETHSTPCTSGDGVAATNAEVHYFDALHLILLSQIRCSNSTGTLALLTLPEVSSHPLFWRTCTYRAGLVAALLTYAIEHTGQTTVSLSTPPRRCTGHDEDRGVDSERAAGAQSALTPSTSSSHPPLPTDVHHLTAYDLYRLLRHCIDSADQRDSALDEGMPPTPTTAATPLGQPHSQQGGGIDKTVAAVSATYAAALSLLLLHRSWSGPGSEMKEGCGSDECSHSEGSDGVPATQDDKDLQLYLRSVMRALEAVMQRPAQPNEGEEAFHAATTATKGKHARETASDSGTAAVDAAPMSRLVVADDARCVDLAALVAVIQEHYSTFTYVNPLEGARRTTADGSDSGTTVTTTVSPPVSMSTTTTTAAAEGNSSASRSAGGGLLTTTVMRDRPTSNSVREGGGDDSDGEDAVTMLQRLPAISATRWTVPASTGSNPNGGDTMATQAPPPTIQLSDEKRRWCAAHLRSEDDARRVREQEKRGSPAAASPAQLAAEQARVSAAIRTFDAFSAALEQQQQQARQQQPKSVRGGVDYGFRPVQRHRDGPTTSSAATAAAGPAPRASEVQGWVDHPARHASAENAGGARQLTPTATAPLPAASLPQSITRATKRRHKFSAKEDAAILHGVAQFGQGPGAFQYIYHAYRTVWLAGRTATHLYDHWRGALRRRAVSTVSDEALMMNAEPEEADNGDAERDHHERNRTVSLSRQFPDAVTGASPAQPDPEPTSDIEDSSLEDAGL